MILNGASKQAGSACREVPLRLCTMQYVQCSSERLHRYRHLSCKRGSSKCALHNQIQSFRWPWSWVGQTLERHTANTKLPSVLDTRKVHFHHKSNFG